MCTLTKSHCSKSLLVLKEAPVSSNKLPGVVSRASPSLSPPPAAGFLVLSAARLLPLHLPRFRDAFAQMEEQIPAESLTSLLTSFHLPPQLGQLLGSKKEDVSSSW